MTPGHESGSGSIDFHGIAIALAYAPFAGDAFPALFKAFPKTAPPGHALCIELAAASRACDSAVDAEWLPTFFHGLIQGYSRNGDQLLSDGQSRLEVRPRLGQMYGRLFEGHGFELSSAMQHIALGLLLREHGVFDLHAAAACTKERALVVLGDSGAGKTTLLLALMARGCEFLGDDRLLFRAPPGEIELLAYPREFHVTARTAQAFPELAARLERGPRIDGKYPVQPLDFWPDQFRPSWRGPISLLLPSIAGRASSTVRAVNGAEAFGKLLASSAAVAVDGIERRTEQLDGLHALANAASAYDVALGTDLLTEPRAAASRLLDAIEAASQS